MKSSVVTLLVRLLVLVVACTHAFTSVQPLVGGKVGPSVAAAHLTTTNLNMVFGNRKSKDKSVAEAASKYWEGDWVCKDCGYIYNRRECAGMFFEEQGPGFRCPQCSGPRRRYAKMVGDRVGTTLDGGDAPILLFSFGGVIATIAFGIWAVNNL